MFRGALKTNNLRLPFILPMSSRRALIRSGKLCDKLLNAVQAGFGCAVIEDGEEILAALDCGQISPGLFGARMASESQTDHRRQVVFRVHRRHEILSDAFGPFPSRCRS